MKPLAFLFIALSLPAAVSAQDDIPLLIPEERHAVESQADEFNEAISPALAAAAKSTVRVWSGSRRLAYGTVVGDGSQVLSKWSELARAGDQGNLRVGTDRDYRTVRLAGIYQDEDLALLEIEGEPLVPVKWSLETPALGSFIAAPQPDSRLAAFGVVSVLERNLRDTDMAYLGIFGDAKYQGPGVRIDEVAEKSPAEAAGLKAGQIILKVGDRPISGVLELKNSLTGVEPGATVSLLVQRGDGTTRVIDAVAGNRPDLPQFSGDRLRLMERMGGPISEVRDSFTHVIQTDMRPKPNQIGGPVVDLKGNVLGITMARADRTRSFVMPSAAVMNLLKKPAADPLLAMAGSRDEARSGPAVGGSGPRPRVIPPARNIPRGKVMTEERMRRHLSDMRRLMEHMQQEMEALEAAEQP